MASLGDENPKSIPSNLPKNVDWSSNSKFVLYQYQGFWYPGGFIEAVFNAKDLQFSPSNIVLCSSPKTGTTWLKALALSIVSRSQFDLGSEEHPLRNSFLHDKIPYIESRNPSDQKLPLLSTHMNYASLPKSIIGEGGCRIVYIWRNPKDVFVSYWHFVQKLGSPEEITISLDKAFDLFSRGISLSGPYWDHVIEYWKASLENPEKILFLKYEDMKENMDPHVRRLAEFLGHPFSKEEESDGIPAKIVEMCSFKSLSGLEVNKPNKYHTMGGAQISNSILFRKAEFEDWRNYLTNEMAAKLDDLFTDKLGGVGLSL